MEVVKMSELSVNVTKTIHAQIEKVFDAWLNPEILSKFILPMPGMPHPETEVDAREGGSFTIVMQVGDDKIPHTGKYIEISRPNKLIFTWESMFSTEGSTVTLRFNDLGENKTSIDLTHVKFADEESRTDHEGGWGNILETLNVVLS